MADDDKTVPLDQLIAEREKARKEADARKTEEDARKAVETERDDLKAKLTEQDRAGLGELDRLKAQINDLTAERDTARQHAQTADTARQHLERSGWVRDAASKVNFKDGDKDVRGSFHSAADAVALLDLDTIRSTDAAQRAVTELAQRSRHLVQVDGAGEKPATQSDLLKQVLDRGKPLEGEPDAATPAAMTEAEGARDDLRSAFAESTTT